MDHLKTMNNYSYQTFTDREDAHQAELAKIRARRAEKSKL